jgi:ElaB/YqjD/DUF883 family membrane-anchored ribosome-binding protein
MLEMKEKTDDTDRTAKGIADRGGDQARAATQAAGDNSKETSGVMGAVKQKMHDVADGATELAGKATDKAQEWASSVGDAAVHAKDKAQEWASSVGDAAVHAKDLAKEAASATVDKTGDLGKEVTSLIRRYPIPALLIGVGAGFLLGQVLHSSSKRA